MMKLQLLLGSLLAIGTPAAGKSNADLSAKQRRLLRSVSAKHGSDFVSNNLFDPMPVKGAKARKDSKDTSMDSTKDSKDTPMDSKSAKAPTDAPTTVDEFCPFDPSESEPLLSMPLKRKKKQKRGVTGFSDRRKTFSFPEVIMAQDGGVATPEVVGGDDVDPPRKYAFFAQVGSSACGASLIAPNVVLSAAHCFLGEEDDPDFVTLGLHKIIVDEDNVEEFSNVEHIPVKRIAIHPDFRETSIGALENDFWLIELEWSTTKYMSYVVELDTPDDMLDLDDGRRHTLIGMGFGTLFSGPILPNILQEVELDYLPNDCCGDYPPGTITEEMMCAADQGRDTCQGDSGGPLIDKETGKQVGIVSWGFGCASPRFAGVYARVSEGYDWIESILDMWGSGSPPSPAPEVCDDEVEGWFDEGGPFFNCLWYALDTDFCEFDGGNFANGGLTANLACCACAPIDFPESIAVMNDRASLSVTAGYTGSYGAQATEPVAATITQDSVRQDPDQNFNRFDGFSTRHEFTTSGAALLRFTLPPNSVENDDIDLDLYLYDPQGNFAGGSFNDGTDEIIEVTSPADGTWSLYVHGFFTDGPSATYDLFSWTLAPPTETSTAGINALIDAPDSVVAGEAATIFLNYDGLADGLYLGAVLHFGKGAFRGSTIVNIDNLSGSMNYPSEVSGNGDAGNASFEVRFDYTGFYEALPFGLVPAETSTTTVIRNGWNRFDFELVGSSLFRFVLPSNAVSDPESSDLDVYLVDPINQVVDSSELFPGNDEVVQVVNPADGDWKVYVFAFELGTLRSTKYSWYSWDIKPSDRPSLAVTSFEPGAATEGEVGTINIGWTDATEGEWHLGFVAHNRNDTIQEFVDTTLVSIDNRIPVL